MRIFGMFVAAVLPLALGAADLLPNGGFENDTGWKVHGLTKGVDRKTVFAYDTEVKRSGNRSMRVMDTWDFARSYPICVVPAVKDAKGYRLTFGRGRRRNTFSAPGSRSRW